MDTSSCNPKNPFIQLDEDGQAAILSYQIPQESSYTVTGYVSLGVSKDKFKQAVVAQSTSPVWNSLEEIKQLDTTGIQQAVLTNNKILVGFKNFEKSVNLETVRLEKLSNSTLLAAVKANKVSIEKLSPISNAQVQTSKIQEDDIKRILQSKILTQSNADIKLTVKNHYLDESLIAQKISKGFLPVIKERFSGKSEVVYVQKPKVANPQISLVFHMRMSSFLGDYGAGQTIKTIHLLPGEKTTITMRTFSHSEQHKEQSKNVLDSFSESSADELQNTLEKLRSRTTGKTEEETSAETDSWNAGGSLGLNILGAKIDVGGGVESGETYGKSTNESLSEQVSDLEKAVTQHVSSSNSERQITINTETKTSLISETEETIVRQIENINKSRVLNFVFRQLIQEYISITYIEDVSVMFTNGFPESKRVVKISQLDSLLNDILVDATAVKDVRNLIYRTLCNIHDYQEDTHSLIEKKTEALANCIDNTDPVQNLEYVRIRKGISMEAEGFKVPGIIKNVKKRTLRTDSVVVDALLGQGEALDCYNQNLQQAAVTETELDNQSKEQQITIDMEKWQQEQEKIEQAIAVINGITDPVEKAKLYKKVFTDCCDVPQSGGCGCNDHTEA